MISKRDIFYAFVFLFGVVLYSFLNRYEIMLDTTESQTVLFKVDRITGHVMVRQAVDLYAFGWQVAGLEKGVQARADSINTRNKIVSDSLEKTKEDSIRALPKIFIRNGKIFREEPDKEIDFKLIDEALRKIKESEDSSEK